MKQAIGFILFCLVSLVSASGPGVTTKVEPAEKGTGTRLAVPGHPPAVAAAASELQPLPPDSGWTLMDSLVLHAMIPAGQRLAVVFDSATESLRDTLLPVFLNDSARIAVAIAPDWLKDDLADNFRRLGAVQQSRYSDVILNCPDKRYYDELCFQVAHLAPGTLSSMNPQILTDNVQQAYQIDPELHYVDIVDYGDPLQGGDYYSTTRYRAVVQGETTMVEIPRDIYYWWIVMPKTTDEPPAYVYDYFWREYLFYECDSGYPRLREKLANTQILWNGEQGWWAGNGVPFDDTLPAVGVVGRWVAHTVPFPAQGNRPIQPNQIAHEHDGNCGETQDLLCAAARTALIPCGGVLDINEDHVWCEIWWQGEFHPWQVDLGGGPTNIKNPGCAYDKDHGGGKECSGIWDWRNDGWQRSVIGTYSDVCTLTVQVYDTCLRPVDGEIVKLSSEGWGGGMANCFFGVTDRNGRYTTTLGDYQNYYLDITGPVGGISAGMIIDSAAASPGSNFFYPCTLAGRLDSLAITGDSGTPLDQYRVDVSYSVGREVLYGYDCYNSGGANEYALVKASGATDFFIASQPEFLNYVDSQPFHAFVNDENVAAANHSLVLSEPGNHYAVFSNEEQGDLMVLVDATVRLYGWNVGVAETPGTVPPERWASISASPFRDRMVVRLDARRPADAKVRILDRAGRVVRRLAALGAGQCQVVWDGTDRSGRGVSPGVYFCQVSGGGRAMTRPVVYLGAR
ncbi:MAG: hypothetical protein NTX53_09540 [candidate division WOR-3 bacterium]|nr:hypothetical protein [candidate division WOR-3 bacterium]